MKKKTLVPLITFLLGICLVSLIVYKTDTHEKEQRHITAQLNVATHGERIKNEITNGIEITDTLKQILMLVLYLEALFDMSIIFPFIINNSSKGNDPK